MKKIYVLSLAIITATAGLSQFTNQKGELVQRTDTKELIVKPSSSIPVSKGITLWSNEFDNSNDWLLDNSCAYTSYNLVGGYDYVAGTSTTIFSTCTGNGTVALDPNTGSAAQFRFETDPNLIPVSVLSPFASATASNGFLFIDSDGTGGGDGDGTPIFVTATIATPIDLTGEPKIVLSFSHNYRWWQDTRGVRVSPDNGTSWYQYEITNNSGYPNDQNSSNPEITNIDISSIAGGQSQVLIQFYYEDNDFWAWYWAVDDVKISRKDQHNIANTTSWIFGENSGGAEYGRTPVSHLPQNWYVGSSVTNDGVADQTNVVVNADFGSFNVTATHQNTTYPIIDSLVIVDSLIQDTTYNSIVDTIILTDSVYNIGTNITTIIDTIIQTDSLVQDTIITPIDTTYIDTTFSLVDTLFTTDTLLIDTTVTLIDTLFTTDTLVTDTLISFVTDTIPVTSTLYGVIEADSTYFVEALEPIVLTAGVYNGTFTASSDSDAVAGPNSADNIYQRNFEVTTDLYSLDGIGIHPPGVEDIGAIGTASFLNNADNLFCATMYRIKQNDVINSVRIYISSSSQEMAELYVYILDSTDMAVGNFQNAYFISESYVLTADDISLGYIDIPVAINLGWDPNLNQNNWDNLEVTPGNYYVAVELLSSANTFDVAILDDRTVTQPFWESAIFTSSDLTFYSNGNAFAIQLMLGEKTSVNETTLENVAIYPNPSNGIFNIKSSDNVLDVYVFDISGKLVHNSTLNGNSSLDLSELGKGSYIIEVRNSSGLHKEIITIK